VFQPGYVPLAMFAASGANTPSHSENLAEPLSGLHWRRQRLTDAAGEAATPPFRPLTPTNKIFQPACLAKAPAHGKLNHPGCL
jgi:hypothetical protein